MGRVTGMLATITKPGFLTRTAAEDGQDLLEYGLVAALISILAIAAVTSVGRTITDVFWNLITNGFRGL